jgi:hypothetical protein
VTRGRFKRLRRRLRWIELTGWLLVLAVPATATSPMMEAGAPKAVPPAPTITLQGQAFLAPHRGAAGWGMVPPDHIPHVAIVSAGQKVDVLVFYSHVRPDAQHHAVLTVTVTYLRPNGAVDHPSQTVHLILPTIEGEARLPDVLSFAMTPTDPKGHWGIGYPAKTSGPDKASPSLGPVEVTGRNFPLK